MNCCVPDCETTAENVAEKSKPEGAMVKFHDFPTDTNTINIWRKALGIKDVPDNAMICSLHFLDDDIHSGENGVTQIADGAIPSPVQFCTMCLDTVNKLYSMSKYKLEDIYEQFTGKPVCNYKYMKPAVCMKCLETLVELNSFRQLSLKSRAILSQFGM